MEEKNQNRADKLTLQISQSISKSIGIPVFTLSQESIQYLVNEMEKIPRVLEKYTKGELWSEAAEFLQSFIFKPAKDSEEISKRLESFEISLTSRKKYEATIILPSIIDLPVGTKIGPLEIIEKVIDNKLLTELMEYHEENNHIFFENRTYSKVYFEAYTTTSVVEKLYERIELPLAIISLILMFDINPRDCVGIIESKDVSKKFFVTSQNRARGWSKYVPKHNEKILNSFSNIFLHTKPTDLEKKILQGTQIYGISRLSQKTEIKFILLISALESLLLTKNDRDYLGKKLSEKVAFLLGANYGERKELYEKVKRYYTIRSDFIHEGKMGITENEQSQAEFFFRSCVIRLLELSKDYMRMEKKQKESEKEGVEDFINRIKFS